MIIMIILGHIREERRGISNIQKSSGIRISIYVTNRGLLFILVVSVKMNRMKENFGDQLTQKLEKMMLAKIIYKVKFNDIKWD